MLFFVADFAVKQFVKKNFRESVTFLLFLRLYIVDG